jgi:thioredoxin 1
MNLVMATIDVTAQALAETLENNEIVYVDFAAAGITSIPTLMAFRDKTLIFSLHGALNAAGLEQVIEGVKNLDMAEVRGQAAQQQA